MKVHSFIFVTLLTVVQFLCPSLSQSEEEKGEEEIYSLGEVVVSAKRGGVESVGTVSRVDAEDIQTSGARNLNEAVDLLPGLNVMVGGDAVPKIDIRGFRPRHNLLLLNGIPINSTYDQQFNPSIIPVENIAEIKLTTGASSVLYGQGGLGGVINIITKKGTEGTSGMIGGEVGEGAQHIARASISGAGDRYDYFVSGSYYDRNAYPLSDDFEDTPLESKKYRDNSDKKNSSFFVNFGYDFSPDFNTGVSFSYITGKYGIPVVAYASASGDIFAPNKRFERMDDLEGLSVQVAADYHPIQSLFNVRGWVFYNQMDEEHNRYGDDGYDNFTSDPLIKTFNLDDTATVKGLTLQPRYDFGDAGALTFAFSAQQDTWESRGDAWTIWSPYWPPGYVQKQVDDDKKTEIYLAAVQYEYTPSADLGLVFGCGYNRQDQDEPTGGDIDQGGHILPDSNDSDNAYSLMAGAYYDITDNTRLKTASQRNIRFPSIRQLYDEDSGNPSLETERVYHYTAGIEQELPADIHLDVEGFYTVARNFIEKDSRRSEQFQNYDKYLFSGFEITADVKTFRDLTLRTSYSYLQAKDKSGSGRDELQYRPKHRVTLETRYDFNCGFTPYASLVYVTDQYYYSRGGSLWEDPEKAKLGDYTVVNVKLNQKIAHDKATLYVGAENAFDEDYEQSYGYPLAGRLFYTGVEFRF